jgi:hypothetical protein
MHSITQLFSSVRPPGEAAAFKLPIEYLSPEDVRVLSPAVLADLELDAATTTPMYFHAMSPAHEFAEHTARKWSRAYTTNLSFLKDTRAVIRGAARIAHESGLDAYTPDCASISRILADLARANHFMEDYSFVDITGLDIINRSPAAMQAISAVNLGSPILSFFMPAAIAIAPFIILRARGERISISTYASILRIIAGNHFIGHTMDGMRCLSLKSVLYMVAMTVFYIMQMYTNTMMCVKYYTNVKTLVSNLIVLRTHITVAAAGMAAFARIHASRASFAPFCVDMRRHAARLVAYNERLAHINPFKPSAATFARIGDIMTAYYEPRSCPDLFDALHASREFVGYMDNLRGLAHNIKAGRMQYAAFVSNRKKAPLVLKNQRYPPHAGEKGNTCAFSRSMVLTGPNASGKTTLIKATCINIIFSQQFACGFYDKCAITPFTHIYSYLNIPDSSGRDSLFQAESRRCLEIISAIRAAPAKDTHFCIFDELYSGTNPDEAVSAGNAFLTYLANHDNVRFVLTTHYTTMCERLRQNPRIAARRMRTTVLPSGELSYSYQIENGVSYVHGAASILAEMGYPNDIIQMVRADA